MFEFLPWLALVAAVCSAAFSIAVFLRVSEDCRKLEAELDWQKGLWKDLASHANTYDKLVVDLAQSLGYKLAKPKPQQPTNSWERSL